MSDAAQQAETRTAGRGGLFFLGSKVFFIVIGFVQQALLGAVLGLSDYGALARVLAPANIVNNVVIQGSVQGVSRRVAPVREHFWPELRAVMRVHVPLAIAIAGAFALFGTTYAEFQRAPYIATPLRTVAIVALAYGVYAPLVGTLNGRTHFGRQAMLDVIFATLRTAGLVGVGWLFVHRGKSGAVGATLGFAAAAVLIVPLAARWAIAGRETSAPSASAAAPTGPTPRQYLWQLAKIGVAAVLVNALMQADIALAGRFLSDGARAAGIDESARALRADEWVGVYRACQLFAFLPYQLVLSVAQVLFPMVARAHAEGDREHVRRIVERGMRIAAILAGGLVAVVATLPGTLLHFAYGPTVASRGAEALRILALGQSAFALFGVSSTVLVSLGRERTSAILSGAGIVFVAAACFVLASGAPFGAAQIRGVAVATSLGLFAALAVAGWALRRAAGSFAPVTTLARVAIAIAILTTIGTRLPAIGRLLAPIAAGVVFVAYVVLLVVLRELRGADAAAVREITGARARRTT